MKNIITLLMILTGQIMIIIVIALEGNQSILAFLGGLLLFGGIYKFLNSV